jgi:hypothetical protein
MESISPENKKYFEKQYQSFSGRADLYIYFIENGVKILKKTGLISFICSNKFIKEVYGKNLRNFLVGNIQVLGLIDFGELPVFQGASTFPAIFLFGKSNLRKYTFNFCAIKNLNFSSLEQTINETSISVGDEKLTSDRWSFFDDSTTAVIEKILAKWKPLSEYQQTKILYGIKTGLNKAFIVDKNTKNLLISEDSKAQEVIKPLLVGNDIRKYRIDFDEKYLLYMHHGIEITLYPSIQKYLEPFKESLKGRATNQKWFELQQPQQAYSQFYDNKKIIWPDIAKESRFTFDDSGYYLETTCFFIPSSDFYLLGILNSSVCWYYLKEHCPVLGDKDKGGRLRLKKAYIEHFPIRTINPNDPSDIARHDRMVALVTQMLDLNKKLQDARLEQERTMLSRQIEATDGAIDKLVYELYGLTGEEIAVVEMSGK